MEFDLSKIEMSPSDIRRRIRLPKQMTVELAEFIGIIIGDGNLSYRVCSQNGYKIRKSDIRIAGNVNEGEYLSYVIELFENLFNITMYYREDKRSKAVSLTAHSMGILHFLNIICRIPLNRKVDNVNIPAMIMKSSLEIKYAFLRGLADTDFSVTFKNRTAKGHTYPVIKGTFKSKNLINDLERLFYDLNLKYSVFYNEIYHDRRWNARIIKHNIFLYGRNNFKIWDEKIGFSNMKFIRKVVKWKKDGYCPPGY